VGQGLPDPEAIRRRGWRQWLCVASADLPRVLEGVWLRNAGAVGARLLVVTQSCDLVHESYENEPVVEVFLCEDLGIEHQPDGNLTAGKSPRSLQVQLQVNGEARWIGLRSSGRALVPRHRLVDIDPDPSVVVTDHAVRTLQRWIVNRTVRAAFPDAFNARTRKAQRRLEERLKKGGTDLLGLYISLKPWEELPENQSYEIDFVGLVPEGLEWAARQALERVIGEVAVAYEACDGITGCDHRVLDEEEAPLRLLNTHRLFPLDYLSLRDKPGGELAPLV
jgi:hypothetical protein